MPHKKREFAIAVMPPECYLDVPLGTEGESARVSLSSQIRCGSLDGRYTSFIVERDGQKFRRFVRIA